MILQHIKKQTAKIVLYLIITIIIICIGIIIMSASATTTINNVLLTLAESGYQPVVKANQTEK